METGISMEQLQEILKAQSEMTKSLVTEAIKAARAPSEEELEKKAELQRRAKISRENSARQMQAEEDAKKQRWASCAHKKENGKWATGGQVIAGKYSVLVCQRCQKTWYKEFSPEVTAQLLAGDVVLHQASPDGWSTEMPWKVTS